MPPKVYDYLGAFHIVSNMKQFLVDYVIRQETVEDYAAVEQLVKLSFADVDESDHNEHILVKRLRESAAFIPDLSIVAEAGDGQIIGYILLTKVCIVSESREYESLGVAPVCILPTYQRNGIGGALIREAHNRAIKLGYSSAVLLGHESYYPRFGYRPAHTFGIDFPFDAPKECCMAIELLPGGLKDVHSTVRYDNAFMQ